MYALTYSQLTTHNLLLLLTFLLTTLEVRALRQGVARYSARCAHVQGSKCWPKLTRTPRGLRLYVRATRMVAASRVLNQREAQGSLPPGPHALYVLGTRTSRGRTVRTARRDSPGCFRPSEATAYPYPYPYP